MGSNDPTVDQLVDALSAAFPDLDETGQRLAVTLYRTLAEGRPVAVRRLAERSGVPEPLITRVLADWPGVFRDDAEEIIGFWGLALPEMAHGYRVDGRQLSTWCAWDTLFITPILDRVAEVESSCPVTHAGISLTVDAHGIRRVEPAGTVVSFLSPSRRLGDDVITTFCHYVLFLSSADAGEIWTRDHPGTFLLSLEDAFELGVRLNQVRFNSALG